MATSIRPFRRSWLFGGVVLLLACGGGGSTESSTAAPPVIGAFAVAPTTITSGQDVTLSWSVSSAESLSLSPGIGVVTGTSATVHVSATTTYTLTATNANGTDTAQSTVTLAPAGTVRIVYLHHSTGGNVWGGGVPGYFTAYDTTHGTHYQITERAYPDAPYPWANYPYDYWNLWVNPSGPADDGNPNIHSLEKLCSDYDVIVFKHCFPVSDLEADTGSASVSSSVKRAENYKLQYAALKTRLNAFPTRKFIVWTGAARTLGQSSTASGQRARAFFAWVKNTWDVDGDNVFVWDFFELETEGGNFLRDVHSSSGDSHPNGTFCSTVAPYLGQRIVDVIEGRGDSGSLTGH
jgi:hypothetical protein